LTACLPSDRVERMAEAYKAFHPANLETVYQELVEKSD
jgi:hypothetical protein